MSGDGRLGAFVDVKLKDVGAGVVADNIKIVFPADDLSAIDFSDENGFVLKIRSCKEIAERVNDAASPARDHGVWIIAKGSAVVGGKIAATIELIAGEHEAATFDADVAHGSDPGIARISRGCAVELDSLGVHRGAHERQIIFPADDSTEFPERRVIHRHGRAVAESPDETLGRGGHEFTMFAEIPAVRREEKDCAIECAAIAFDHTHDKINVVCSCDAAKSVDVRTGNVYAAFPITLKVFAAFVCAITNNCAEIESARIGGDESLGKNYETRALASGFGGKRSGFLDRAFTIKCNGRGLDDSGFERVGDCRHEVFSAKNLAQESNRSLSLEQADQPNWIAFNQKLCEKARLARRLRLASAFLKRRGLGRRFE